MPRLSAYNIKKVIKMADLSGIYAKTGGFIKGICHPGSDREGLLNIGVRWVRRDIPYPYDGDGSATPAFRAYRDACAYYAEKGIYTVGITPYPRDFIAHGADVRTEQGLKQAEEICARLAGELSGMVRCWQITNEMHVLQFRAPLTEEESVRFIVACTNGVRRGDPAGAVGHNSCCEHWLPLCAGIEADTGGSDYIGLDCYAGTWGEGGVDSYAGEIDRVYGMTKLPVILMEFGFASFGESIENHEAEILAYLNARGFADMRDMLARTDEFIETMPEPMKIVGRRCAPADKADYARGGFTHLLKKWWYKGDLPHTEEGQAEFYRTLLPKLTAHPHLAGAVIYCWQDSKTCFTCGEDDCPCETAWGITRADGTHKPAYEAIGEAFR